MSLLCDWSATCSLGSEKPAELGSEVTRDHNKKCLIRERQLYAETGSAALRARLQRQATAEKLRPPSRQRQTQANAAGRHIAAAAAPKSAEDQTAILHRHTGAAVLDLEHQTITFDPDTHPQAAVLCAAAILAGVVDQVA